ncbi:MAG: chemotaxis protein CheC [Thermomicrobiales bacterium]
MVQPTLPKRIDEPAHHVFPEDSPVGRAIARAADAVAAALSELSGIQVHASNPEANLLPLADLPNIGGSPGDTVVTLFLTYDGTDSGQIILIYNLDQARALVDQMLWNPPGTTFDFDEMELSALAESANILGSHFLTAIANISGAELDISIPEPLVDLRGATLSIPAAAAASSGDSFLSIRSDFESDGASILGTTLLVIPDRGVESVMMRSLT